MPKPLEGIRVLELTTYVAAPCCGRLLSDLGADVIKIERASGDAWRGTGKSYNTLFNDDANPVFDIYNSGKRFIDLNLKTPEGLEVFHKLLADTDVFITNTRPKALKRLGISYEDLKDRYPGLIYAIVLGYGEEGPDKDLPAFDTTAFWSSSGFLRDQAMVTGEYMPVNPPSSAGDTVTCMLLLSEVCAALVNKQRTGKGDYVRSGLYHNGIFTMGTMEIISQKPWGKKFPQTRIEAGVPGGMYCCADGEWIYIAFAYAPAYLKPLCAAIDQPELAEDPRFATVKSRGENRESIYQIFRDAFLSQPCSHWLAKAKEFDLPMVRMKQYQDVTTDEQAWVNGYLEEVTFRNGMTATMPRSPINMDSVGELKTQCAPHIGADTEAVLKWLGYQEEEIEAMKKAGAISTR